MGEAAPRRSPEDSPRIAKASLSPLRLPADDAYDSRPFPQRAAASRVPPERGNPAAGRGMGPRGRERSSPAFSFQGQGRGLLPPETRF